MSAGAVALLAVAVYAGTLGHEFVFDDTPEVVDNEGIRSLRNVPSFFAQPAWKGSGEDNPIYRPLTTATYALNHALSGLSPWSYHLGNVLLHALAAVLVLALALELGLPSGAGLAAAALFAVHPVHVEAVANVAGRKDLLATVFTLAAVLAHARALRRGGAALVAAPLAVLAAMLSKESGLACLAVIAVRDLVAGGDSRRRRGRVLGLYAAYGVVLAGYLAARWGAVGSLGVPAINFEENPIARVPAAVRVMTAVAVIGRGLALMVAPVSLSPDYSHAAIDAVTRPADPGFLLSLAVLVAAVTAAVAGRRRAPALAFAVLWYLATLFPASNLAVPIGTIFGERLLYTPSVGFCLGIAVAIGWLSGTRARATARWITVAAVVLLAWRTAAYAAVWKDELSLFAWGARVQPRSAKMQQCLGAALMERGRPAEALPHFQAAVEIARANPEKASSSRHRLELGVAYEALARLDDAAAVYREILRDDPRYADASWRLGVVQWAAGMRSDAVATWQRTVQLDPRHARALSDLGIAASLGGDVAAARAFWERAVAADPRLASAWYRLGNLYERSGDLDRARWAWSEFLNHAGPKLQREQAEVRRKLGGG